MTSRGQDTDTFRRQQWAGWLGLLVGGPLGLAFVAGGLADGVPAVAVFGLGLLLWAWAGVRTVRSGVVLELDDDGFVDHRSGVRIAWDEVEQLEPRVGWQRGFRRSRRLDLHVRDPAAVRDRVTNRAGRFIIDHVPRGDAGQPSLELNALAADPNDVLDAFERRSGTRIPQRFTLTGLERR